MSYEQISPEVYQVYQPDTPWHAGARGWWSAPIPGWGQNPNLLDTHVKAVQGLGCGGGCGCKGAGQTDEAAVTKQPVPIPAVIAVVLVVGAGLLLLRKR